MYDWAKKPIVVAPGQTVDYSTVVPSSKEPTPYTNTTRTVQIVYDANRNPVSVAPGDTIMTMTPPTDVDTVNTNSRKVRFIYLAPSDRPESGGRAYIAAAAHALQIWFQWRMGNRKTFSLYNPICELYNSPHNSSWFPNFDKGGVPQEARFYINTRDAAIEHVGSFTPDVYHYILYADATPLGNQYVGGSSDGIAVLWSKDIRALQGLDPDWTLCRAIGGSGHELGHTFGLAHPDGSPYYSRALMGTGYSIYPQSLLLAQDKTILNTTPFFERAPLLPHPNRCPF